MDLVSRKTHSTKSDLQLREAPGDEGHSWDRSGWLCTNGAWEEQPQLFGGKGRISVNWATAHFWPYYSGSSG